ncbi:MAG: MAPEG family protein [Methylophagaceae bacterium]
MAYPILQPAVVVMLLTIVVWTYMYFLRNRYVITNKIKPQDVSSPELVASILPEYINRPSNNLKNLFELPVIFYFICLALNTMELTDPWFVGLAWAFATLRIIHSFIHCTFNNVFARFSTYVISSFILWAMVIKFAFLVF